MKILVSEKLSPNKYIDNSGYLICKDAILARTGKQQYRHCELFGDSDETIIDVDRTEQEVFSDKTLASFENKPVTVEHPMTDVNPENYKDYSVGFVRDVKRGKTQDGQDVILGTLVITDAETIDNIQNGIRTELSCGYDCDLNDVDGTLTQCNIRGNHVALCMEGRAGIAKIVDSKMKDSTHDGERLFKFLKLGIEHNGVGLGSALTQYLKGNLTAEELKKLNEIYKAYKASHANDCDMCDADTNEIVDLIKDEEEAIAGYERAIANAKEQGDETAVAEFEHILQEEQEHIKELKALLVNDINDSLVEDAAKPVDTNEVDVNNYVEGRSGVYFAKAKSEKSLLTVAYCSADRIDWYKCYLEPKSSNNDVRTQAGKYLFRTPSGFPGQRTSIGRNVLTWYSNNGEHYVNDRYQIDHVNGDYTDDRLSNLEKVTPQENIRRMLAKKAGDTNDGFFSKAELGEFDRGSFAVVKKSYFTTHPSMDAGDFKNVYRDLDTAKRAAKTLGSDYVVVNLHTHKIVDTKLNKLVKIIKSIKH